MSEIFTGSWAFQKAENYEEFLKALDLGFIKRKVALQMKPTLIFSFEGEKMRYQSNSAVKSSDATYTLGAEQADQAPTGDDGVQVWRIEGDKMMGVFTFDSNGNKIEICRTVVDGVLVQEMSFNGKSSTRFFKKE